MPKKPTVERETHQCPACERFFADADLLAHHTCTAAADALAAVDRMLARENGDRTNAAGTDHRRECNMFASRLLSSIYTTAQQLDHATSVIEQAELIRAELVDRARQEGLTWTQIGQQLGMTKQAAQQRYGAKKLPTVDPNQLTLGE
jgi:hypothetical protein